MGVIISDEVIDKAKQMLSKGITAKQVAQTLGISYSTIYRRIISQDESFDWKQRKK